MVASLLDELCESLREHGADCGIVTVGTRVAPELLVDRHVAGANRFGSRERAWRRKAGMGQVALHGTDDFEIPA